MQSMTEKKKELEAACANAVKAKDYAAAAKAAADVADCAEILAARTTGVVAEAYANETTSWRKLAKKLEARKNSGGKPGGHDGEGAVVTQGDEWLVAEKPDVTFDDPLLTEGVLGGDQLPP